MIKQRQKIIRLADESELGWKVVDEYMQSEIASDEEDQKKIHRAQARARVKAKSERGKRSRRYMPYRQRPAETVTNQTYQSRTQQQHQQKPGVCYLCGQVGHWKADCPTNKRNFKLSKTEVFISHDTFKARSKITSPLSIERPDAGAKREVGLLSICYTEKASDKVEILPDHGNNGEAEPSPYNRLKGAAHEWRKVGTSSYILSVIEEGYKIPFKEMPPNQKCRNNRSARDNPEFVSKEIKILLAKGCISKVGYTPYVINPLTVAYNKKGKPRLVLDCRNLNKCLHTFKFKYEDISTARQMFEKGTFLYAFDIRGAYNHIDIFHSHRTYLGFAWREENGEESMYVYNSLCFGLATAGHIFSKVVRVMVAFWRSKGHKVITFLDDGLGGDRSYQSALESSNFVKDSIQRFGFLLAEEKCKWLPMLQVTWLGYFICMNSGKFYITDDRIKRLECSCKSMLYQLCTQKLRIVPARFAASITGQIISMQMVLGKIVRLRTRELYKCIDSRLNWDSPVYISEKAEQEVKFWSDTVKFINLKGRDFNESVDFETVLFCDASSVGYGGYLEYTENQNTDILQTFEGLPQAYEHDFSLTKAAISNLDKVSLVAPKMAILDTPEVVKSVAPEVVKSVTHGIVDTDGRKSSTREFMKTTTPEVVCSVTPEVVRSVTPEVVRSVIPEVVRSVTPEVVRSVTLEVVRSVTPEVVRSVTPEVVKSVTQEVVRSVDPEMERSVTSEVVRSVTPEVVMSVTPEVVRPVTPEVVRSDTPEVVMSVTPKVVRSETHKLVSSVTPEVVKLRNTVCSKVRESKHSKHEVYGAWTMFERSKSSTWREAEAVKRVMVSSVEKLRGKRVKVFSDNKNVQSVLEVGSTKEELQSIASEVNDFCDHNCISLSVGWIPRSLNEKADHLSRCKDCDDWEVSKWVFDSLEQKWGTFTVDRFASNYNNKCKRFNSKWWVPDTEGVNALHQNWAKPENNWLVPPPRMVLLTLQKMEADKGQGALILPDWPSAPFYPVIFKGKHTRFVKEILRLPKLNIINKGLGNNGIFESNPLAFDMLALRLDFS